jgi:hypothetical protein
MGDDFENAFLMTYGKPHWAFLRNGSAAAVDANIWQTSETGSWHQGLRFWLASHSILYQLVVHGPVLGQLKGAFQIARASGNQDSTTTTLVDRQAGIQEAFRPLAIRARVDQQSAAVREGMRITFALLADMDRTCRAQGCQLVVVVIPTKETVFADRLLGAPGLPLREVVGDLVANEAKATAALRAFLQSAGIPYVEPLPELRRNVQQQLYARSDRDMHPSRNGYRVIGETVAAFLDGRR